MHKNELYKKESDYFILYYHIEFYRANSKCFNNVLMVDRKVIVEWKSDWEFDTKQVFKKRYYS